MFEVADERKTIGSPLVSVPDGSSRAADLHPSSSGHAERLVQLRTLRIGMQTTLVAPLAAAAAVTLASRTRVDLGPYAMTFVGAAVASALATLLPWNRLFEGTWGMRLLYALGALNVAMIAVGVWATGGPSSPIVFLYAVTTIFFAVAFPPRGQALFFLLTLAAYALAVDAVRWDPLPIAILAVLAFLANFLVRQMNRQMLAQRRARQESDRRWAMLVAVSAAARDMSTADPRGVLQAIVDAIVGLGFSATRVYGVSDDREWRVVAGGGGLSVAADRDPALLDLLHRIVELRDAVEVGESDPRLGSPALRALGLHRAIAIPLLVSDRVEAVLLAGSDRPRAFSPEEIEVARMLATQGSLALETAHRLEEQRAAIERMTELDRMKTDFLSNVSHELRTPLTAITGMGRMLEQQWSVVDEQVRLEFLGRLNANAAALNSVITQLLDFSQLEAGGLRADLAEAELRPILAGVIDRLAGLLTHHTVQLDVEVGLTAVADPGLLERVVENLLSNASKYTPPGSLVRVTAHREVGDAVIAVSDDGPGIPPHELGHIGKRFFRGGDLNTRHTQGTGLGLALVSEILDLQGTTLEVTSQVGVGSRFAFRLPVTRADEVNGAYRRVVGADDRLPTGETLRSVQTTGVVQGERFPSVLIAAQRGVEWAISALYREFHPRILRYLRAHDEAHADEVGTLVWMDVAAGLPRFEGDEGTFRRWLFSLARQRVLERRAPIPARPDSGATATIPVEERTGSPDGLVEAALARVAGLPPEQAEVVLLGILGDLDIGDIAAITEQQPGLVHLLESQALRGLRETSVSAGPEQEA